MNALFRQIRFPLILFLCLSLAFPPELVAQSYDAAGRAVRTLREVNDVNGTVSASVVTLSQTQYNSIDKPCKVIDEFGVVTAYEYDELGNTVETKSYDNNDDYTAGSIRTISQSLYDKEGRAIVAVDAHAPDANANGTQTVYDVLGRAVESRRWSDVNVPIVDINGDPNIGRANLYDVGANNDPNWTHSRLLSVTKTEYDIAGHGRPSPRTKVAPGGLPNTNMTPQAGRRL